MREKEPDSQHENIYGTVTFADMFQHYARTVYPDEPLAFLAGVRCEESPGRQLGLTTDQTYKQITWGHKMDKPRGHYTFYPLYDWSYTDIWKAICDHDWLYCKLYDVYYQYGLNGRDMRVSNLHHETAIATLFRLQEIEPETWAKVTRRLKGINTAGQLGRKFLRPRKLPPMFSDWREYREYLTDHLIEDPEQRAKYHTVFRNSEKRYSAEAQEGLNKSCIDTILLNDYHYTNFNNYRGTIPREYQIQRLAKAKAKEEAQVSA